MCDHCGLEMRGSAGVSRGGKSYNLCHPDIGRDCYQLVTLYREPIGIRKERGAK
jgi:hypothetical protein